jgi:uncharacterized damage-inducible protein DinB
MKKLLQEFAAYNAWANQRIVNRLLLLNDNFWTKETPSSFNSIYKTVVHSGSAEGVWLQRIYAAEMYKTILSEASPLPASKKIGFNSYELEGKEAGAYWLQQSKEWAALLDNEQFTEAMISQPLEYKNSRGDRFSQPLHEVLLHMFNHSTYHRGQLVTMLHCLGVGEIPPTDFIVYSRGR